MHSNSSKKTNKAKSVGGTPAGSPIAGKPTQRLKSPKKIAEDPLNNTTIVDVERVSLPSNASLLEKTSLLPKTESTLIHCPCDMLDRKSIPIKCTTCSKDWHTECCNLTGLTRTVVKKLEGQSWKCPWCFKSSYLKPGSVDDSPDESTLKNLLASMSRVLECTDMLNDNASNIEYFNEHIRHLLLDGSKFKEHSEKMDKLTTDVDALKNQITALTDNLVPPPKYDVYFEKVLQEIKKVQETTEVMPSKFPTLPSDLPESLKNLSCNISDITSTLTDIDRATKFSATGDMQEEMGKLLELVGELSSQSSSISTSLEDSASTISMLPIDKINLTNEGIVDISSTVSEMSKTLSTLHESVAVDRQVAIGNEIRDLKELVQEKISNTDADLQALSTNVNELANKISQNSVHSRDHTPSPMQPNTSSPHYQSAPTIHEDEPTKSCEPFTSYDAQAIQPEMKSNIINFIESCSSEFKAIGADESRDVLYFGEWGYRYSGGNHDANPIPQDLQNIIDDIIPMLPDPEVPINSCLISRYQDGSNYIAAHSDDEPVINPESSIITVSLGADRTMRFSRVNGSSTVDKKLNDGSIIVASRFSQDYWRHEILKNENSDEIRYSLTLRHIAPHFLNSTIILGDSNTEHIKFGSGVGKLGAWMPGKRIKAGHIGAIPEATQIGPYRNIIIHTGVNSINSSKYRESNASLIKTLESKIMNISSTYPKAKIYVSLLLPSRSRTLNHRIVDFNNMILDLTCRLSKILVIDNSIFGTNLSNDHGRWIPSDDGSRVPHFNDILHLGKYGLRQLAVNMKNMIVKKKSPAQERHRGGQGDYGRAAARGPSHQRDQPSH